VRGVSLPLTDAAAVAASLRQVANGHRWRYLPAMDWTGWIRGLISAALQWFEAHPGTASWLEAVGSITAIVFVYLFALFQGRRTRSHESTDRIRRAQGLALVLIPALIAFRPKIEMAIIQESKPAPPEEIVHLLDQLYVLGLAGGLILQMVAVRQANQRAELAPTENENARSSYNSIARQRLGDALRYCDDAIYALMKLTRVRTATNPDRATIPKRQEAATFSDQRRGLWSPLTASGAGYRHSECRTCQPTDDRTPQGVRGWRRTRVPEKSGRTQGHPET
jgi:hypothetical protein